MLPTFDWRPCHSGDGVSATSQRVARTPRTAARPTSGEAAAVCGSASADVILDVQIERGALHLIVAAHGTGAAHGVRVRFSRSIRDVAGMRLNDNPLFTHLEFLAPGRRVSLLVDSFASYVQRRQPMRFEVRIEWRDDAGRTLRRSLTHDLTAWSALREMI
jgi:hypothetical protein